MNNGLIMIHHYASSPWDIFAYTKQPSVYVISDSEMKSFKDKNTRAEIAELERIVDERKRSIEQLEATIVQLKQELPALSDNTQAAD